MQRQQPSAAGSHFCWLSRAGGASETPSDVGRCLQDLRAKPGPCGGHEDGVARKVHERWREPPWWGGQVSTHLHNLGASASLGWKASRAGLVRKECRNGWKNAEFKADSGRGGMKMEGVGTREAHLWGAGR